ncbi:hypothetical protein HHI36_022321 [Cryptolaemus montrouzieri]|uniref:Uncharacterized protein n=1 Tax=Cryptolaemus montrouzieri TaxID=559131 RepID=A0ABD2MZI5_9CUCU
MCSKIQNQEALLTITNSNEKNTQVSIGPLDVIEIYPADIDNIIESPNVSVCKNSTVDNLLKRKSKNLRLEHLKRRIQLNTRNYVTSTGHIPLLQILLSFTNIVKHEIRMSDETPIFRKAYRMPEAQQREWKTK